MPKRSDAYAHAVKLDPLNGIAAKNLQRLGKFAAEGGAAAPSSPVDPRLFIEESGKTTVTLLSDVQAHRSHGQAQSRRPAADRAPRQPARRRPT